MTTATLEGHRVTRARVSIPKWGCWYADVSIDGEIALSGRVTLKVADLTLIGTVLSGGAMKGRSTFTIVAGAGGWGRVIPAKNYADDGSTKASKAIGDAAQLVGETVGDIASTLRVGPGFTRPEGPASQVLQYIAPRAWYVDEAGVTQLGQRPASALVGTVTRIAPVDLARGKVVLAAESIATILPGLVVDGLSAVDVQHDISADGGLRSTVWGAQDPHELDSITALLEQLDPDRKFRGVTEYRVGTIEGGRLNLQPERASSGMPTLRRVPIRPGIPGCVATPALGSTVLVGFIDSDPGRPYATEFVSETASDGLSIATDGLGAGGHAVSLEQVVNMFVNYTASRYVLGDLGTTFSPVYSAAPPATLAALVAMMLAGTVAPVPPGVTPGGTLDALALPAAIAAALLVQLPDPASIGLPTPVMPGLGKANFRI